MTFPPITKFAYRLVIMLMLFCAIAACGIYPGTSRGPIPSPLSSPLLSPTSMISPLGISEPTATPTPTPDVNFNPTKVTPRPTLTPTVTPVVINVADAWPRAFTFRFIVQRANGRREIYYVPVGFVPMVRTEGDWEIYDTYAASLLKLGPDDTYVSGCAMSYWLFFVSEQMRCLPPRYSPAMGPTPTP